MLALRRNGFLPVPAQGIFFRSGGADEILCASQSGKPERSSQILKAEIIKFGWFSWMDMRCQNRHFIV